MGIDSDHSVWAFSQTFTSEFRSARSDLETRLERAKNPLRPELIQTLSADIAKLAKALADAAGSLPTYDQKVYETQLKALETSLNELRVAATTKPRFAFKRRPATVVPATHLTSSEDTSVGIYSTPSTSSTFISSHSYAYLTTTSLVGPTTSDLIISEVDHCILNLLSTTECPQLNIAAIHLRNISNSVLLLPTLDGSILIQDLSRCVIVTGCHQFRMHSSTKVDVFLSAASNPIIEDCHDIRFAPYPAALVPMGSSEKAIKVPLAVQDFSHIRSILSPNWVHMDHSDTNRPWPMKPLQSKPELESSLLDILPT